MWKTVGISFLGTRILRTRERTRTKLACINAGVFLKPLKMCLSALELTHRLAGYSQDCGAAVPQAFQAPTGRNLQSEENVAGQKKM